MKNRYMLIQVIEREFAHEQFDRYEDARDVMRRCFEKHQKDGWTEEDRQEKIDNGEMYFGDWNAYITDGVNHDNYDWWIVDLELEN